MKKIFLLFSLIFFTKTYSEFNHKKFGISYINFSQSENGKLKKGELGFLDFHNGKIKVDADIQLLKLDYFPLPFLGFYGVGGSIDTKVTVKDVKMKLGNISIPIKQSISKKSNGYLYGGGVILGAGYKNIFITGQYTYTDIVMNEDVGKKTAEVYTGRLGYNYRVNSEVSISPYFAITRQQASTAVKGKIKNIDYNLDIELEENIPSVGVYITLPKNFTLLGEYSFGDKKYFSFEVGYRF